MALSSRGLAIKQTIPLGVVRKAMARGMKASVTTAALSQISREVDVQALGELRRRSQAESGKSLSLNTLIMAAVARTLPRHPLLNAELQDDAILAYEPVNLGMAVAVPDGLIVVVIPDADKLPIAALAAAIEDRAGRARGQAETGGHRGRHLHGEQPGHVRGGRRCAAPAPPESAILLVGAARPRPVVHEGQIVIRDVAWFSLSFDHRFIDGALAARFLQDLQALLLDPQGLLRE